MVLSPADKRRCGRRRPLVGQTRSKQDPSFRRVSVLLVAVMSEHLHMRFVVVRVGFGAAQADGLLRRKPGRCRARSGLHGRHR